MSSVLVSISGPEGVGKSTAIREIRAFCEARGVSVCEIAVARLAIGSLLLTALYRMGLVQRRLRTLTAESLMHVPSENRGSRPNRVRARLRSIRRGISYIADAVVFRMYLCSPAVRRAQVVVCDRYFYDGMARIIDDSVWLAAIVRAVAPRPACSILLYTEIEALLERRPRSTRAYYEHVWRRFTAVQAVAPELLSIRCDDLSAIRTLLCAQIDDLRCTAPAPDQSEGCSAGRAT